MNAMPTVHPVLVHECKWVHIAGDLFGEVDDLSRLSQLTPHPCLIHLCALSG